jgi:hypothetical protein
MTARPSGTERSINDLPHHTRTGIVHKISRQRQYGAHRASDVVQSAVLLGHPIGSLYSPGYLRGAIDHDLS